MRLKRSPAIKAWRGVVSLEPDYVPDWQSLTRCTRDILTGLSVPRVSYTMS